MRTMRDSIRAKNIPADSEMVAGYVDEYSIPRWTDAEWARFPHALKVRIAKRATTNDGHVLDVEDRLAMPSQAPGWARMRRAAGLATPTIYCNRSTWPLVQQAFDDAEEPQPLYWIATASGEEVIPVGAIAAQYLLDTDDGTDISVVADYWPGVDVAPATQEDDLMFSHKLAQGAGRHTDTVTIESDGISALIQDVYVSLVSGFDGLKNVTAFFPGGGEPAAGSPRVLGDLPKDTRAWWKVPRGCYAFSLEWDNASDYSRPALGFVYTKK